MKLPNGYGSVYKLSGNRRRPWVARKTIGWDDNGKQQYYNIGYYATRAEALTALAEYNNNPYSKEVATITFEEVWKRWWKNKFNSKNELTDSTKNGYISAYKLAEPLHQVRFVDLRVDHLQDVINDCELGHGTLRKIKTLYNQLYKYAMANDIVEKNYAQFVDIGTNTAESTRVPFTKEEIQKLFDNVHRMDFIDTVLIMIFSGIRIGELLVMRNEDIDIDKRIMRGGLKTVAGKNRVIPLNKKIIPFIEARLNHDNEYLIVNHENNQMNYWNYYEEKWKKVMEQLEMDHRPHDCRHTFASIMDSAGANKLCIKRIMGHASQDITDKIYTHKDIEELIAAVDLI